MSFTWSFGQDKNIDCKGDDDGSTAATNLFSSEDQMCFEYVHRAFVAEERLSTGLQAPLVGDAGRYQDLSGMPRQGG
jgi:hypothetical protein